MLKIINYPYDGRFCCQLKDLCARNEFTSGRGLAMDYRLYVKMSIEHSIIRNSSSYPRSPNSCPEAVVDCVGKPRIFIQWLCLTALLRGYDSPLRRTRMLLPNAGRMISNWLSRGFIQCANMQVHITWSITTSVQKFGGCGYGVVETGQSKSGRIILRLAGCTNRAI